MNLKLRNSCFFLGKQLGFFITVSLDVHFSMLLFVHVFISSRFHFYRCFWVYSSMIAFVYFIVSSLFFRYFVFALLYRECYGFERACFTPRCFLPYTLSCFYQGFPGAGSSALKVSGLPTEVQNTEPQHQFVWTKQCSTTIW